MAEAVVALEPSASIVASLNRCCWPLRPSQPYSIAAFDLQAAVAVAVAAAIVVVVEPLPVAFAATVVELLEDAVGHVVEAYVPGIAHLVVDIVDVVDAAAAAVAAVLSVDAVAVVAAAAVEGADVQVAGLVVAAIGPLH